MRKTKTKLEKVSGIGGAGLVHVFQNVALKSALKSRKVGKHFARGFTDAVKGKGVSKTRTFGEGVSSAVVPEYSILTKELRNLGQDLNRKLIDNGVTELHKRDLVLVRHLTRGNFSKLLEPSLLKSPNAAKILKTFKETSGVDLKKVLSGPEAKAATSKMDRIWASSNSEIQKNTLHSITTPIKRTQKGLADKIKITPTKGDTTSKTELLGSGVGNLLLAGIDPITAGVNTSKVIVSNPASRKFFQKFKTTGKALKKVDDNFVNNPISESFEKGKKKIGLGKTKSLISSTLLNSGVEDIRQMSNNLGQLSSQLDYKKLMLKKHNR